MRKIIALLFAVSIIVLACKSIPHENPGTGPVVTAEIPELFSPDPDITDDKMTILISVTHPIPIKDWTIQIQPNRTGQRPAGEQAARRTGAGRRVFFEQKGSGAVPAEWQWNGKNASGEMVQSAMEYRFTLSVNDLFNNNSVFEGTINTDVIVIRDGDKLRIVVPSIIFPPDKSDLGLVADEDDRRSNARVLRLVARTLNRFDGYRITVEGHANPTTRPNSTARTNENPSLIGLSRDRAQAVINSLVTDNGINGARLTAIGIGGERTVAPWDDGEENWKNRRVEFILER